MSKISSMRVESLDLPPRGPFEIVLRTQYNAPSVIVSVETETDVVGLGEGSSDHYVTNRTQGTTLDTISKASELLVGRDVANCRAIVEDPHATFPSAISPPSAPETMITDTYCREIDILVAELSGGSPGVVKTDMTIPIHMPDVAAKRAESVVQNGFETLKIKVGGDLETDIQRARSVSEAIPDATITVDVNQG